METTYIEMTDVEVRDAGGGRHELEGLCVPYNTPTHRAGPVPEVFRPGAFAGAVAAAPKIRLTEYHPGSDTGRRPVGVAAAFEERPAGLFGTFRFYNTPQGRAAWENAREGTYGGLSVGFHAEDDVKTATGREIRAARLHHVALVDEPAYEAAQVLAVRAARRDDDRWAIFRQPPTAVDLSRIDDTPMLLQVHRRMSR